VLSKKLNGRGTGSTHLLKTDEKISKYVILELKEVPYPVSEQHILLRAWDILTVSQTTALIFYPN
jgi:hypothetical protein